MKLFLIFSLFFISLCNYGQNNNYGMQIFKKGNCNSCHHWHADGGVSYGGAAMSLRTTALDEEDLTILISCGRIGTNMPYFSKKAYKDDRCYGLTFADFEGELEKPLPSKVKLNDRQIKAVVTFIISELKGKEITKDYCLKYFGKPTKTCEKIK